MRFEREDVRLGLVVLMAVALFSALAFQHSLHVFVHPEATHPVRLANAAELAAGADVMLLGFKVGEVHSVEIERDESAYRFVAVIGIRRSVTLWRGTRGVVTSRVVGGPFLDLQLPPREERRAALSPGEAIDGECAASAGALVTELTTLTKNLDGTVTELRQEVKAHGLASILEQPEVRRALGELGSSLAEFREAARTMHATLEHGDRTLASADRSLASLEKTLAVLERRGPEMDAAIAQLGPALEKVETAGSDMSAVLKGAGPEAGESLRELHRTLTSVHELLELLNAKPNRLVFGTPSPKERDAARKRVAEASAPGPDAPH